MRPDIFLATIGRGSNGSNALEVTEDRAAVTAESQDNIINRVNNVSQYGPSWHYVPGIGVAGTAYAEVPDRSLGDLAFTRASSKTRTNAAGVVQTIGNNVPPHDYRNADGTLSTFPRLNLEPQRTNSLFYSENFDNAYFTKGNSSISTNVAISPSGQQNADKLVPDTSNSIHSVNRSSQLITSGIYSVFAKADGYDWILLTSHSSSSPTTRGAFFNVNNGTVGTTGAGVNAKIQNCGNGWYRCSISEGSSPSSIWTVIATNADNVTTFAGNGTDGVLIWGGQNEVGTYATTYIPTTTAAVTRLADVASKTGVSSLIGQTEGTIFAEVNLSAITAERRIISITSVSELQRIMIWTMGTTLYVNFNTLSVTLGNFPNGSLKIAVGYTISGGNTTYSIITNGGAITSGTLAVSPTGLSQINVGSNAAGALTLSDRATQAALFKTRLTNAQLAQLTTL